MRRQHLSVLITLWTAFSLFLAAGSASVSGQERKSDLALVLAVDASGSINESEFKLQLDGIAKAFRHPEVLKSIWSGAIGRIDVALLIWAEGVQSETSGWYRIGNQAEAEAFAAYVESFPRRISGSTFIGNAIMSALHHLRDPALRANRYCIDLSGDGKQSIVPYSRTKSAAPS